MHDNSTIRSNHLNQEAVILRRVSRIVSRGDRFDSVLESLESVLEEAGARIVALEHWSGGRKASGLSEERHTAVINIKDENFPYEQVAALREGGRTVGQMALAFRHDEDEQSQKRLAVFVGQQLGMLLGRLRLAERNQSTQKALDGMKQDIAGRKFLPRAIALLIRQYRMRRRDAEVWLRDQSRTTGLSTREVAERLVAAYTGAPTLVEAPRRSPRVPSHRVA
jgi:hypothetical protein